MNKLTPNFDDTMFKVRKNGTREPITLDEVQEHANSLVDGWFKPLNPFNEHVSPLEFIADQFIARGMITIIGGVAGSGKSILTQYLLQLRSNQYLISTVPGKAIYLTGLDSSETEIRRRAKSIGSGKGLFTVAIPDEVIPFITNDQFFEELKTNIKKHEVDVIVFDTLADFHEGSLYEAADANATMTAFRRLATATGAAIVIITHTRKSAEANRRYTINDIADSRIFGTKADFGFAIRNEYQNDQTNLIEIQCVKSRSPKNMPDLRAIIQFDESMSRVTIQKTERPFSAEAGELAEQKRIEQRREQAYELKKEGKSNREIGEILGVSHVTIIKDLKQYEKQENNHE